MEQVLFIVWRESVEALLVVGILHAWMNQNPQGRSGKPYLWGGVALGLLLAVALAVLLFVASGWMGAAQDAFQAGMVFVASALIVQMVLWMRAHGRTLKRELESGLAARAEQANWWGVTALAAIAPVMLGSALCCTGDHDSSSVQSRSSGRETVAVPSVRIMIGRRALGGWRSGCRRWPGRPLSRCECRWGCAGRRCRCF